MKYDCKSVCFVCMAVEYYLCSVNIIDNAESFNVIFGIHIVGEKGYIIFEYNRNFIRI